MSLLEFIYVSDVITEDLLVILEILNDPVICDINAIYQSLT